ncbi:DUF1801 domain-containing protein [Niabella pedocola]|uniref:DUF1801 domain-containing protein n=1 Tax=Niabella pedocola TaxID=1752077 RepID=A0ABS8PN95_9BACT|nr:DUF1801 domain-containing protein [Niabella pedocola]MCD2421733.1 DUF1801 domain-containing protein [Niabella pedocola]
MAKTDFKTIDEYQNTFPAAVQERMQQIRRIIKEMAPEAEEVISYQIPAFRIGKQFLIYYSAYAKHISLSSPWSPALLKEFETELEGLKVSRSAIQLPSDKPLPTTFIKRLITFRKKECEAKK